MRPRNIIIAAFALTVGYAAFIRPRLLRWGATEDDRSRALPGDDLIARPLTVTNRAISIAAPVGEVWP